MNTTVASDLGYKRRLAALNDRLLNRQKYAATGENVDLAVDQLQRWLMAYENCHPKRTNYTGEVICV